MKLGIAVVYMVAEGREALLDLHLERIARHTTVPYTIYGVAPRLAAPLRAKLEQRSDVRLLELPPTELRDGLENSYYLEQLIAAAFGDACSHVVTMHVDSFPVRDGWAEALAATLSERVAFATIVRITTACLFFPRWFYEKHRPVLYLSDEVLDSAEFRAFNRRHSVYIHSGTGYGLTAYQAGLEWYSMQESARVFDTGGPCIFDDRFFHLDGAMRLAPLAEPRSASSLSVARRFAGLIFAIRRAMPDRLSLLLRAILPSFFRKWIDWPRIPIIAARMRSEGDRLLEAPDQYLEWMRNKGKGE